MHLCIVEICVLQGLDSCPEKREFEKRRKSRCRQGGKPFHLTQVELKTKRKLEDGRGCCEQRCNGVGFKVDGEEDEIEDFYKKARTKIVKRRGERNCDWDFGNKCPHNEQEGEFIYIVSYLLGPDLSL
jgi:hypothetical protein